MGRQSGFIAMMASMASGVADLCLIPEINFSMPKLLEHIDRVIARKGHCVICVAEGAGQVSILNNIHSGVEFLSIDPLFLFLIWCCATWCLKIMISFRLIALKKILKHRELLHLWQHD